MLHEQLEQSFHQLVERYHRQHEGVGCADSARHTNTTTTMVCLADSAHPTLVAGAT